MSSVSGVSGVSFRFLTKKPPDFGPNRNKPEKSVPTRPRHIMATGNTQKGNPPTARRRHTRCSSASHRRFFFGGADFFSAKRLFFRAARDVSGERSAPPWARVGIKLKMRFQALSHLPSHERASALTSPPPDFLFSSIHQTPTIPPNLTKSSSRLHGA